MTSSEFVARVAKGEEFLLEDEFGFHKVSSHPTEKGFYQVDGETGKTSYAVLVEWFGVTGLDGTFFFPKK